MLSKQEQSSRKQRMYMDCSHLNRICFLTCCLCRQESHYGEVDGTDLTSQRSASGGYCIQIATVFDKGTWVEMCQYLSIPVNPGKMYGGIKISSLKYTISHFLEDDHSSPKIPQVRNTQIYTVYYIVRHVFIH
jgi:hypothetical protein